MKWGFWWRKVRTQKPWLIMIIVEISKIRSIFVTYDVLPNFHESVDKNHITLVKKYVSKDVKLREVENRIYVS